MGEVNEGKQCHNLNGRQFHGDHMGEVVRNFHTDTIPYVANTPWLQHKTVEPEPASQPVLLRTYF